MGSRPGCSRASSGAVPRLALVWSCGSCTSTLGWICVVWRRAGLARRSSRHYWRSACRTRCVVGAVRLASLANTPRAGLGVLQWFGRHPCRPSSGSGRWRSPKNGLCGPAPGGYPITPRPCTRYTRLIARPFGISRRAEVGRGLRKAGRRSSWAHSASSCSRKFPESRWRSARCSTTRPRFHWRFLVRRSKRVVSTGMVPKPACHCRHCTWVR
mmetsp:Transcript_71767/g.199118  ORF Transcript_71767/g.199118 Transcript_71767/m.199118 type:complete len:213 (-) Transcript_71767:707-1345(-)